jgi:hypothetical protein
MLHTTGRLALDASACLYSFQTLRALLGGESYGMDTPIGLDVVCELLGLSDARWALRCVLPGQVAERDRFARRFACDCAERVLPLFEQARPDDPRPREAIATARRFAAGEATPDELAAAWDAARAAIRDAWNIPSRFRPLWAAESAAASAAESATEAARVASEAAAWAGERLVQRDLFLRLLRETPAPDRKGPVHEHDAAH